MIVYHTVSEPHNQVDSVQEILCVCGIGMLFAEAVAISFPLLPNNIRGANIYCIC